VTGDARDLACGALHRGAAQVCILGSMSPLPKNYLRYEAGERVLDGANQVLVRSRSTSGSPEYVAPDNGAQRMMVTGGKRLKDVLPAEWHLACGSTGQIQPATPTSGNDFGLSSRQRSCSRRIHQWAIHALGPWAQRCAPSRRNTVFASRIKIAGVQRRDGGRSRRCRRRPRTPVSQLPWSPLKVICRVWVDRLRPGRAAMSAYREIA